MSDDLVLLPPKSQQVTHDEAIEMAELVATGLTASQISEIVNRSPDTVRRHLEGGKRLLQAMVPEALLCWRDAMHVSAKRGRHRAAMDLLERAGVIPGRVIQSPTAPAVQVQVGFVMHGLPAPAQAPLDLPVVRDPDATS